MTHPSQKYRDQQAATLALLPEGQREYMARMFRIGNATYRYYQRANELMVFNQEPVEGQSDSVDGLVAWLERQINPRTETRAAGELLQFYFEEYLSGLPHEGLRRTMKLEGLEKAKRSIPFLRYLLERHDIGMDEFLRQHLSEADYAFHLECGKPVTDEKSNEQTT
ncbi:hypothetical protein [Spirosoma pomorum]